MVHVRYQIAIKAENLWGGLFRRPSPYAEVKYADGPRKGTKIGKTETIEGTSHPDFVRVIFLEVDPGTITHVRIVLYDHRGYQDAPSMLGQVEIEPTEVFQSSGHIQAKPLGRGKAKIFVSVIESNPANVGTVTMHLRGLDVRNVEPGLVGLGRSDPFFEISKKDADHASGQVRWNVVYRSEHLDNHLNPYWEPFDIGLEELCNGDMQYPIRIAVFDHNKRGKHKFIGAFETKLATMIEKTSVKGNADRDRAFELTLEGDDGNTHGLICVLRADVQGDS